MQRSAEFHVPRNFFVLLSISIIFFRVSIRPGVVYHFFINGLTMGRSYLSGLSPAI